MHWTQATYLCLLILAIYMGRPIWLIGAVMLGNLTATMAFASDPYAVGAADALSAAILLTSDTRAKIVAMLFSVMIPVYVSAQWLAWPASATYAIIDLIALLQLGVIGGVDRGIGRACRAVAGRRRIPADTQAHGGHAAISVASIYGPDYGAAK